MKFYETIDQVIALLHSRGRLSYRALSVEFDLNENSLTTLKEELIEAQGIARDENGKVLVWTGERPVVSSSSIPSSRSPITYTPAHLAERICVEQTAIEARGKSITHRSSKLT